MVIKRILELTSGRRKMPHRITYYTALFFLLFMVFVVYSNTLSASWHFDDYPNVSNNPRLKITDLKPSTLVKTFYAGPLNKQKPYRALPYLTLALNWYFHRNDTVGYHVVNILIHLLTALVLSATILNLFRTPNLKNRYPEDQYFIALLTAALWALNPVQTQAVTYIVQRMASMAALFYLLAIYSYLNARLSHTHPKRVIFYVLSFISFIGAIFSKENAALLPVSLLLVEAVFFQDLGRRKTRTMFILIAAGGFVTALVIGGLLAANPLGFLNGYPTRLYTPAQRLLTEPRIIMYYLSQLFYPVPTRLSIVHDVVVSTSFLKPWTTLPGIISIVLLLIMGFKQALKRPILSFAILFFFLNHLVESTVIGLELVFEHRNYLPSLFLFLPVATGLKWILGHYHTRSPAMVVALQSFIVLLLVGLGSGTYIRNMAWATEKTLWEDAISKAPNNSRPLHQLAYHYYEKTGQYDMALKLYHKALKLSDENVHQRALRLNNIASIHFTRKEYALAEFYWKEAIQSYPKFYRGYYRLSLTLIRLGRWEEAGRTLDRIPHRITQNAEYSNLKGIVLLKDNKPAKAIPYFNKGLQSKQNAWKEALHLGVAHDMLDKHEDGFGYLELANALRPNEPLVLLCLAQNSLQRNDFEKAGLFIDKYLTSVGEHRVENHLESVMKDYSYIPISPVLLRPLIAERIKAEL